jgi:hypothetical protein
LVAAGRSRQDTATIRLDGTFYGHGKLGGIVFAAAFGLPHHARLVVLRDWIFHHISALSVRR